MREPGTAQEVLGKVSSWRGLEARRALSHPSGQLSATVWEGADMLGEGPDRQWGLVAKGMGFSIGQDSAA